MFGRFSVPPPTSSSRYRRAARSVRSRRRRCGDADAVGHDVALRHDRHQRPLAVHDPDFITERCPDLKEQTKPSGRPTRITSWRRGHGGRRQLRLAAVGEPEGPRKVRPRAHAIFGGGGAHHRVCESQRGTGRRGRPAVVDGERRQHGWLSRSRVRRGRLDRRQRGKTSEQGA